VQERNGQPQAQPTPAIDAYAQAAQNCRDIAQQVGIRSCDADPDWKAAEWRAEDLHAQALAAGHTYDELTAADKARKAQG